jgi:hypothetical protein
MFTPKKIFWSTIFCIGASLICLLLFVPLEAYMGIDMPWIQINRSQLNIFGYEVIGPSAQGGVLMMSGILMMLPARMIHASMIQLGRKNS